MSIDAMNKEAVDICKKRKDLNVGLILWQAARAAAYNELTILDVLKDWSALVQKSEPLPFEVVCVEGATLEEIRSEKRDLERKIASMVSSFLSKHSLSTDGISIMTLRQHCTGATTVSSLSINCGI